MERVENDNRNEQYAGYTIDAVKHDMNATMTIAQM